MSRRGDERFNEMLNMASVFFIAIALAWVITSMVGCAGPSPLRPARLSAEDVPQFFGRVIRMFPSTVCDSKRGFLPYVYWSDNSPRVDGWIYLTAGRASISDPADPPLIGAWVMSHYLSPEPFTHILAPGCQLIVRPDTLLFALPKTSDPPSPERRMVAWSEGATAYLLIKPQPALLGHKLYTQFLELAPGENMLGILASHAVQLWIGNATR